MDKQTNTLTNTQRLIPVNTRTIGTPEGIYILYLEDYVHTFIKKILSDNPQNVLDGSRRKKGGEQECQQEYQIEKTARQEIALYGRSIEEDGRYRIVISGAGVSDGSTDKIQKLNNTYFPSCSYIGNACVSLNKDSRLRIELTLRNTRVILDDFYIYYDQNEEMQNYLVEWNTAKESDKAGEALSAAGHDIRIRGSVGDAAQLGRITQAYNREEAKVSFMWNVMNVLCLGFVVCVMAYGIISMNNYNKMQNMQENIDYCMALIEENTAYLLNAARSNPDQEQSQPVSAIQQNVQVENDIARPDGSQEIVSNADAAQEAAQSDAKAEQSATPETPQPENPSAAQELPHPANPSAAQEAPQPENPSAAQEAPQPENPSATPEAPQPESAQGTAQDQPAIPQYYVVRKGDTLRTICYSIYGDYSRVDEICQWNNIDDPNNILYGQKLLLP